MLHSKGSYGFSAQSFLQVWLITWPSKSTVMDVLSFFLSFSISCMVLLSVNVEAITDPHDIQALIYLKHAINPTTVRPTSCISTWDFSLDPCENRFREHFTCGIDCETEHATDHAHLSRSVEPLHQRITTLRLESSGYGGVLSPWVGNLSSLRFLQITGNSLTGEIPHTIGMLSQLVVLDLSLNNFSGVLPQNIGNLRNLQTLNLAHNKLQGSLPSSISTLSCLTELRLENNQFGGPLPDLKGLGQLRLLDASNNRFSRMFWSSLPSSLSSLSVRNNILCGKLPKTIAYLEELNVLDLSNNQISGSVNDVLLAHPSLQELNLSTNQLTHIRAHCKHISKSSLVALDLSYNLISGPLPRCFAGMRQLSSLSLQHNFFHGMIPEGFGTKISCNAQGLEPLRRFMLNGNYLTGPLPYAFMNSGLNPLLVASVADNCIQNCPLKYPFCQGKEQKSIMICNRFNTPNLVFR